MKDGGPAFPRPYSEADGFTAQMGMSLLDYYIGQVALGRDWWTEDKILPAIYYGDGSTLEEQRFSAEEHNQEAARACVVAARALLKAREEA